LCIRDSNNGEVLLKKLNVQLGQGEV
jgi:hypothetical protein